MNIFEKLFRPIVMEGVRGFCEEKGLDDFIQVDMAWYLTRQFRGLIEDTKLYTHARKGVNWIESQELYRWYASSLNHLLEPDFSSAFDKEGAKFPRAWRSETSPYREKAPDWPGFRYKQFKGEKDTFSPGFSRLDYEKVLKEQVCQSIEQIPTHASPSQSFKEMFGSAMEKGMVDLDL